MDERFPNFLACMTVGIGSAVGEADLDAGDIEQIVRIAERLHARSNWSIPPNPIHLAMLDDVKLIPGDAPCFSADVATFPCSSCARDRGLWQAYVLAGSLLVRADVTVTNVRLWTLAAELLVPTWVLVDVGAQRLSVEHQYAPQWLVGIMARTRRARVVA